MATSVIVAGVGGQGSVLLAQILGTAAIRTAQAKGRRVDVVVGEMYGAAMRGGSVCSHVRIGGTAPLTGEDKADIVLALEPLEGLRIGMNYLGPDGVSIVNTRAVIPVDVKLGRRKYPSVEEILGILGKLGKEVFSLDATELSMKASAPRSMNIVMLGALYSLSMLPLDEEILLRSMTERIPPGTEAVNLRAFELGVQAIARSQRVRVK